MENIIKIRSLEVDSISTEYRMWKPPYVVINAKLGDYEVTQLINEIISNIISDVGIDGLINILNDTELPNVYNLKQQNGKESI